VKTPDDMRAARLRAGLTQAQLAELVGRSRRWVQAQEGGQREPDAVGVDLACLLLWLREHHPQTLEAWLSA